MGRKRTIESSGNEKKDPGGVTELWGFDWGHEITCLITTAQVCRMKVPPAAQVAQPSDTSRMNQNNYKHVKKGEG